jgi:hypothetical protein
MSSTASPTLAVSREAAMSTDSNEFHWTRNNQACAIARRNGATKTKPKDRNWFEVPVKFGLKEFSTIDPMNASQYHLPADCPLTHEASTGKAKAAPAQAKSDEVAFTWTTWKAMGNPHKLIFAGRNAKVKMDTPVIVEVSTYPSGLYFKGQNGEQVANLGVAGKFWGAHLAGQPTGDTKAVQRAASAGKATSASRTGGSKQQVACKCGCGKMVRNLFAQGHDARFVSETAQAYKAGTIDKATAMRTVKAISDKLAAKLARSIELIDEKQARAAKP